MRLYGIDFTCSPSRAKPIVVAGGTLGTDATLRLDSIETLGSLGEFDRWLARPGPWLGAFDLPFGLPRAFVEANRLGASAAEVVAEVHRRCPTRPAWRAYIDAWGNERPPGQRLLHRRTDLAAPARSTSPLQTRYVPVGLMYYEGFGRLVGAGVDLPGLADGDRTRVALEGYPRRLAHALVERRSYKNSALDDRRAARAEMVAALADGRARFGFALASSKALLDSLVEDAQGDRLDAVLCLVQAAAASRRAGYGLPPDVDPVEGWIAAA